MFFRCCVVSILLVVGACASPAPMVNGAQPGAANVRPNILVITVDDMNADSVGVFGSAVPEITPHIDRLAQAGMRFEHAHVQVANCMPSRNVMWSGRYPHSNKVEGFIPVPEPGYATLGEVLHEAGYFTAIRHKVAHSTPYTPFPWDAVLEEAGEFDKKDADSYGVSVTRGIGRARAYNKPFFLMINISDPHVPFYGLTRQGKPFPDPHVPSRVYTSAEVEVPGFLPDDPVIRSELAHYFSSVRRADDAVGGILAALEASGEGDNTLVLFVSDHGMPFPFAKTQLYHHSTRTPLIVRWPQRVKPDTVDSDHFVSAVDFFPTLATIASATVPPGVQGKSFQSLLMGEQQAGREFVIKEYNQNSSLQRMPMRGVQGARYLYLFNPWSDGRNGMRSATSNTRTFARMKALAREDAGVAARMRHLKHRTVEEFYDVVNDPDCLHNLADVPALAGEMARHRQVLEQWMVDTGDHALAAFRGREDPQVLAAYMTQQKALVQDQVLWQRVIREHLRKRAASSD